MPQSSTKPNRSFVYTRPCNNCPYRTDAPLQHWDRAEFINLLEKEQDQFGAIFGCHKNNGSICVGWLMKQDEAGFPSIHLRLKLSKENVSREYLDKLKSPVPLYGSVNEMVAANYPELLSSSE